MFWVASLLHKDKAPHSFCQSAIFKIVFLRSIAWQTGLVCGYASIPAGQHLQPEYYQYFKHIDYLIVAMDNDEAGQKAADNICKRSSHYHKAQPFPTGKDLTEYYQSTGRLDDVTEWLYAQLEMLPREQHG